MAYNKPEKAPSEIQEALIRVLWRSRLRYYWIALLIFGTTIFALWQSIPDKEKSSFLSFAFEADTTNEKKVDLEVQPFSLSNESDNQAIWIKNKIERNLVELFSNANHTVTHKLSTESSKLRARMTLAGTITGHKTRYLIDVSLLKDGVYTTSTRLESELSIIEQIYKSIPEAIVYGMDLDLKTLKRLSSSTRPTNSVTAYALYLESRRMATANKFDEAISRLDQALSLDSSFAMAYWGKGELYRLLGDEVLEKKWKTKAQAVNADHPRFPIHMKVSNPMPAIILIAKKTDWSILNDGLRVRRIEEPKYGISIFGWSFDPALFELEVVTQLGKTGSTASEIRERGNFILAINGGFFEIDSEYRLSPSGLLVVNSQVLSPYRESAGSGILFVKNNAVGIGWSKYHINPVGFTSAVQSNPLVVDPGGKNGIIKNDFNRLDRSAICLTNDRFVLIVVKGGISLFELGSILSMPSSQGGFGCERALNLDGGPSSQASFKFHNQSQEVEGIWKTQNALVVRAR